MSIIGELVENIYKYGNCKLYTERCYSKEVDVIEFIVTEDGLIKTIPKIEYYDEYFWDDNKNVDKKNINATLIESVEIDCYNNSELVSAISYAIHTGLYVNKNRKMLTFEETVPKGNTDKAVRYLYQIIYSMFQISPDEILNWEGNKEHSDHMLERGRNALKFDVEEVSSIQAIKNIDLMMEIVDSKVCTIREILAKNSYYNYLWGIHLCKNYYGYETTTEEIEANHYKKELESFCGNHEVLKFNLPKNN